MAMSTQNAAGLVKRAPQSALGRPKLKAPDEPIKIPTSAELLEQKLVRMEELKAEHQAATAAHRADTVNEFGYPRQPTKRNGELEAAKLKIAADIEKLGGEIELLRHQVRADRAETVEVQGEWKTLPEACSTR
jgi:hypothetical protein